MLQVLSTSTTTENTSAPAVHKYCQSCVGAFFSLFATLDSEIESDLEVKAKVHDNLHALETSAALGCQSCRLFRHALLINQEHNWKISSGLDGSFYVTRRRNYRPNNLTSSTINLKFQEWESLLALFREDAALPGFEKKHAIPDVRYRVTDVPIDSENLYLNAQFNGQSHHAFALMRRWLDVCQSSHGEFCNHTVSHGTNINARPFVPTRLLEISENAGRFNLRLVLSQNIPLERRPVVYTTLSYCWGQYVDFFTTTHDNYEQHTDAIDIDKLPTTFLHAVLISSQLGVKYLWIDALCIIQPTEHDTMDWDIESPTMHDVYRWSLVTISATSAANVTQGCFADRLALKYPVKPCLITELSGRSFDFSSRNPRELMLRVRAPVWQRNIELAPVSRRGWILQERLLARRILHFTKQAIFWECAELRASEYEPDGCDSTSFAMSQLKDLITGRSPSGEWCRVVEKYSERKLTYGPDKLPALSGIAAFFNAVRPGTYLAGLWKQDLPASLLWWTPLYEYEPGNKPPPRTSSIPSWSWASITTPVDFNQMYNQSDKAVWNSKSWKMVVLEASTELATESPFGRTSSGLLHVRGRFRTFDMQGIDTTKILTDFNVPRNNVDISESIYMCADEPEWLLREDLTNLSVPCMLIHQEPWVPWSPEEVMRLLTYIALEPVLSSDMHQYTRVGVLFHRHFKPKKDKDQPDDEEQHGIFAEIDII